MNNNFSTSIDQGSLNARILPWDTNVMGSPVAEIIDINCNPSSFDELWSLFKDWIDSEKIELVSCRLLEDNLKSSFLLEQAGFKFIEMVLHPFHENLGDFNEVTEDMVITKASEKDTKTISGLAKQCFKHERFHMDPRIDTHLANIRYGNWVNNTLNSDSQHLVKIEKSDELIAFFIYENIDSKIYWHLTAMTPDFQGKGLAKKVWTSMINWHKSQGSTYISTTISARNINVLNLYSSLNFRFMPPEMTFHWMRSDSSSR